MVWQTSSAACVVMSYFQAPAAYYRQRTQAHEYHTSGAH